MIAPLTCFHRNLEMTSHCAITFIYCGFWGSDVGWHILLSYKYYLSLRVRAVMLVCVCIPVLHVCVCARDTTSKGKNNLDFRSYSFRSPTVMAGLMPVCFSLIQSCVAVPLRSFGSASRDSFLLLRIRVALLSFQRYTACSYTVKQSNVPAVPQCYIKTIPDYKAGQDEHWLNSIKLLNI